MILNVGCILSLEKGERELSARIHFSVSSLRINTIWLVTSQSHLCDFSIYEGLYPQIVSQNKHFLLQVEFARQSFKQWEKKLI